MQIRCTSINSVEKCLNKINYKTPKFMLICFAIIHPCLKPYVCLSVCALPFAQTYVPMYLKFRKEINYMDSKVFSRTAQVPLFYSSTLTFIFKVSFLYLSCFANISQTVVGRATITIDITQELGYLLSNGAIANVGNI